MDSTCNFLSKKMYTFTEITLTLNKLWHKTFVKNWQNCKDDASLKGIYR